MIILHRKRKQKIGHIIAIHVYITYSRKINMYNKKCRRPLLVHMIMLVSSVSLTSDLAHYLVIIKHGSFVFHSRCGQTSIACVTSVTLIFVESVTDGCDVFTDVCSVHVLDHGPGCFLPKPRLLFCALLCKYMQIVTYFFYLHACVSVCLLLMF